MKNILKLLGEIDGGIAAAAASWGLYDPAHIKTAMVVAGIAGGVGMALNGISRFMGGDDVVKVPTAPPVQ